MGVVAYLLDLLEEGLLVEGHRALRERDVEELRQGGLGTHVLREVHRVDIEVGDDRVGHVERAQHHRVQEEQVLDAVRESAHHLEVHLVVRVGAVVRQVHVVLGQLRADRRVQARQHLVQGALLAAH